MVTAKMKVQNVNCFDGYRQVSLTPVYSSDRNSPNYSWSQTTPSGEMKLTIANPGAFEQFAVGKTFLLTFQEVAG